MKILITGGAGFLGANLCRRLLKDGHSITCIDNFITGKNDNIVELLDNPNFKLIKHDISEPLYVDENIDWVLHFASLASPKHYLEHPIKTLKSGLLGTYNCLGLAKAKNAKFFLASTSEVYGDPLVHPQPEEYNGNVSITGPRSCYDESKRAAESLTFAYHRQHKIDIRVVRIFNTYGPFMRPDDGRVVSNFILQALKGEDLTIYGEGKQTRSFCYVDDLVAGIIKFINTDYTGPLNLGTTFEFTMLELANKVISLTGSKSKIKYVSLPEDDPKQRRPDATKAKKILQWEPKVPLDEGLKKTIEYFRKII
ncbi:SDR family oxidoreductase [bacterium]|nr:MAG: SDR family oxidoreductase [bacterium]